MWEHNNPLFVSATMFLTLSLFFSLAHTFPTHVFFNPEKATTCIPPSNCTFDDPTLWTPSVAPGVTTTVSIHSLSPIQIWMISRASVHHLDVSGNVSLMVSRGSKFNKLSLAGDSHLEVRNGTLEVCEAEIFGSATFTVSGPSTVLIDYLNLTSANSSILVKDYAVVLWKVVEMTSSGSRLSILDYANVTVNNLIAGGPSNSCLQLSGGNTTLVAIFGEITRYEVSGNANVTHGNSFEVDFFSLTDNATLNAHTIQIHSGGILNGNYTPTLNGTFYADRDAKVYVYQAHKLKGLYTLNDSAVLNVFCTNDCYTYPTTMDGHSKSIYHGNVFFYVSSVLMQGNHTLLAFHQTQPGFSEVIFWDDGRYFLEFSGSYAVHPSPVEVNFAKLSVTGSLQLTAGHLTISDDFHQTSNVFITVPDRGNLVIGNLTTSLGNSTNFVWLPEGQVTIARHGKIMGPKSLNIYPGRTLRLQNNFDGVSIDVALTTVEEGARLNLAGKNLILSTLNVSGQIYFDYPVGETRKLTINGSLILQNTSNLVIPATSNNNAEFIQVNGEAHLGGVLDITMIVGYLYNAGLAPIPVIKASRILGDFTSFVGQYQGIGYHSTYFIANNTVWAQVQLPMFAYAEPSYWWVWSLVSIMTVMAMIAMVFYMRWFHLNGRLRKWTRMPASNNWRFCGTRSEVGV